MARITQLAVLGWLPFCCSCAAWQLAIRSVLAQRESGGRSEVVGAKAEIRQWMWEYTSDKCLIRLNEKEQPDDTTQVELVPDPVFRYSDEYHEVPDASL